MKTATEIEKDLNKLTQSMLLVTQAEKRRSENRQEEPSVPVGSPVTVSGSPVFSGVNNKR